MANMLDYVAWRGDLSFADDKFNEVDAAIFSMLSYIDYGTVCREQDKLMSDAVEGYCPDKNYDGVRLGLIIPSKNINRLFCDCGQSRRFGGVRISDFKSRINNEEICQFAAVTFHLPRSRMVVAFRGTDDSIVGWREDFCLSYLDSIPAQRMAVQYLEEVAAKYPDERIYVCGHSKGGNMSAYATVNCSPDVRRRILKTYSCDGPGFDKKAVKASQFKRAQRKLDFIVPQSSFIGTMFEVGGKYTVVNSVRRGAYQHDSFSWEVCGPSFRHLDSLSERGHKNANQFRASMERMTVEEKKDFSDTFFSIVASTGANTLTDFTDGGLRKLAAAVKNYSGLDKQKREIMMGLIIKLFDLKKNKAE
jgi:hypothetical protein